MTDLEFVTPEASNGTWNCLLYGPAGNGKTMGACSAPGPILLVNADGPDGPRKAHTIFGEKIKEVVLDKTNASQTLERVFLALRDGSEFKTVIFDTMGEIYQALLDQASSSGKISLPMRGDASTKIERYVRSLRDLPVNVVLVCQEQVEDGDEEQLRRPMVGPRTGNLPEKVIEMMSIVSYIGVVPAEGDTPRRWVGQLVEAYGRKAKDRSGGLGDSRDLELTDWFEVATQAMGEGAPAEKKDDKQKEGAK